MGILNHSNVRTFIAKLVPEHVLNLMRSRRLLIGFHDFNASDLERTFDAICSEIDIGSIRSLRARILPIFEAAPHSAAKYADYNSWLRTNIIRAVSQDLHVGPSRDVLDLGCGPGYFLSVCRHFGHRVVGVDMPLTALPESDRMVYDEMLRALHCTSLTRAISIQPFVPLPIDGTFDVITGQLVCFNGHGTPLEWDCPPWQFFVEDMLLHLRPGGRLSLELNANPARYGTLCWYDTATLEYFRSVGSVTRNIVIVRKP